MINYSVHDRATKRKERSEFPPNSPSPFAKTHELKQYHITTSNVHLNVAKTASQRLMSEINFNFGWEADYGGRRRELM